MKNVKLAVLALVLLAASPPAVNALFAGGNLVLGKPAAVGTCDVTTVGAMVHQGGGAGTTRTRLCLCGSDGAATPAYAWCSILLTEAAVMVCTGGSATVCP